MADLEAGLTIAIDTIEADCFSLWMKRLESRLVNLGPLYAELYSAFREIERKRFDAEGPGWKALAASTQINRIFLGIEGSNPILDRSGDKAGRDFMGNYDGRDGGQLRRSLTTLHAKNAVFEPMVDGVFMGTKDPVAKFHQTGEGSNPERILVEATEADATTYGYIVSEFVDTLSGGELVAGPLNGGGL